MVRRNQRRRCVVLALDSLSVVGAVSSDSTLVVVLNALGHQGISSVRRAHSRHHRQLVIGTTGTGDERTSCRFPGSEMGQMAAEMAMIARPADEHLWRNGT
jgi:hypothetical protein